MPINFPLNPTNGQQWPAVNPKWVWNGVRWSPIQSIQSSVQVVSSRLPSLLASDDFLALRGGVPYLVSSSVIATYTGGSPSPTAPAPLTSGQWSLTAIVGGLRFNITELPNDGGSPLTSIEYRLNGGAWTAFAGTGTGIRDVTSLPATLHTAEVRTVNAINPSDPSDTKSDTPLVSGGGGAASYIDETFTAGFGTITVTVPAGVTASDTLTAIAWSDLNGSPATMTAPTGWTELTGVTNPNEGRGARVFTAPGNVSDLSFTATQLSGVLVFATTAPMRNHDIIGVDYGGPGATGANRETPAVTAVADDLGVSVYIQYDDGTVAPMVTPGTPTAGWTREFFKNDLAPWLSVLSRASLAAGSTGTVTHDSTGNFSGRFVFTGVYGS